MTPKPRKNQRDKEIVAKLRYTDAMLNAIEDLAVVLQVPCKCASRRFSDGAFLESLNHFDHGLLIPHFAYY